MKKFLEELEEKYTLEDITGYIGSLLADESDFADEETYQECVESGLDFLQDLYDMASKQLAE